MISIYTDEDVDVLIKPLLHAKGFSVLTALDEGMLGKSDEAQLKHARKFGCTFLTHNRCDFEKLYAKFLEEGKEHCGILVATRRNVYELARRVARLLDLNIAKNIKTNCGIYDFYKGTLYNPLVKLWGSLIWVFV